MVVEVLRAAGVAHELVVHDDVLTREMVEQYRGFSCMLTVSRGVEFVGVLQGGGSSHRYPMVAQDRILPLLKLLVQLQIPFASVPPLPDIPQPWRDAKPAAATTTRPLLTREQRAKQLEEAKLAAARRVLAHKQRQAAAQGQVDPNDAFSAADSDREPDVW